MQFWAGPGPAEACTLGCRVAHFLLFLVSGFCITLSLSPNVCTLSTGVTQQPSTLLDGISPHLEEPGHAWSSAPASSFSTLRRVLARRGKAQRLSFYYTTLQHTTRLYAITYTNILDDCTLQKAVSMLLHRAARRRSARRCVRVVSKVSGACSERSCQRLQIQLCRWHAS